MSKRTVLIIILAVTVGIVAWDVSLYLDAVPGNSISQLVISGSKMTAYVPLCIGIFFGWLIGHWFG